MQKNIFMEPAGKDRGLPLDTVQILARNRGDGDRAEAQGQPPGKIVQPESPRYSTRPEDSWHGQGSTQTVPDPLDKAGHQWTRMGPEVQVPVPAWPEQ